MADSKNIGAKAVSQEFRGPSLWWLHGAALGAQCCSVQELLRQCYAPRAVTFASLFGAKSMKWHHWEAHLVFNPFLGAFSSCLWDVVVGNGGRRAGNALSQHWSCIAHAGRARPFFSLPWAYLVPSEPALLTRFLQENCRSSLVGGQDYPDVLLQVARDSSAWIWASRISRWFFPSWQSCILMQYMLYLLSEEWK